MTSCSQSVNISKILLENHDIMGQIHRNYNMFGKDNVTFLQLSLTLTSTLTSFPDQTAHNPCSYLRSSLFCHRSISFSIRILSFLARSR